MEQRIESRYTEPRAHALRAEYHVHFDAPQPPVPVDAIAEDLLRLAVENPDEPCVFGGH